MTLAALVARLTDSAPLADVAAAAAAAEFCPWCPSHDRLARANRGVSHQMCPACRDRINALLDAAERTRTAAA